MARHGPLLKSQLENPRLKNATYVSPRIQNEIINGIGEGMNEVIKDCQVFSITADEISSFNKEILPLCVRYM